MMSDDYQEVYLRSAPEGIPSPAHFGLRTAPMPAPGTGEVLYATEFLSLDPYMRGQIWGRHISGRVDPGDTLRGESVGRVIASGDAAFAVGDRVRGFGGWRSHAMLPAAELTPLSDDFPHPSLALSTLGMPGLTAWAGLYQQAQPSAGETILIPAVTGAVGSVAAQLARERGCRVVGVAGSAEKCRLATERLGVAHCLNRKNEDFAEQLDDVCPDGIDVYFDLVGGPLLNTVSARLAVGARVILCGLMADYNSQTPGAGPYPGLWIRARATVFGLVVYDFEARRGEFLDLALPLVRAGKLHTIEDIAQGLDAAPEAFCRLMRGENLGKALVRLQ
jgi:NADPH-dependent curcumin reductase CurA